MPQVPVNECPAGFEMNNAVSQIVGDPLAWHYSTDIAAAWELIEKADLLGDAVLTKNDTGQYVICNKYHLYDWPFYYEGQDENVALVICRAFLRANGIDLLHTALDFFMENIAPFSDEDRAECDNLIDKLLREKERKIGYIKESG